MRCRTATSRCWNEPSPLARAARRSATEPSRGRGVNLNLNLNLNLPMISTRGPVADPQAQLNKRITEQYNKLMDAYKQPELDRAAFDKAKQIFIEAGVDAAVLDKIDTL